jgi:hypothetical protein
VPGVLFLPDQFYDHRIWADLPASLGADCDAVCYDVHAPMPWEEPDSRAFLGAVRRLVPDPARTAVAAAGQAAGLAVQAARCGLAGGLVLFQPVPDRIPPDGRFIAAAADTDPVWLEDRIQAKAAIRDMLGRLPIQQRRIP